MTIDYPRWRVSIQPGVLPDADGREVFELNAARELTVPLSIAERSVPCSVDPLFQGGIIVPASFVKDLVVAGRSIPRGPVKTPQGVLDMQEATAGGQRQTRQFRDSESRAAILRAPVDGDSGGPGPRRVFDSV